MTLTSYDVKLDLKNDAIELFGVKYALEAFRSLGLGPVGATFKIAERATDGVIVLQLIDRPAQETVPAPVVNVETIWDCASRQQQSQWAEDAGLLRVSAFARTLPPWSQLPDDWKPKLVPHVRLAANREPDHA